MPPFKHTHIAIATDFELEPVIEQYLATYPDRLPRKYDVVYKLQNERHEGDYCYIIVYEYVPGKTSPTLNDYIKAYCELNDKVARVEGGHTFPDIAAAQYGNPARYQ